MNTRLLAGALFALGAPIIASAQCVGVTPETFLVGKTFAYQVAGSATSRIGAIGTFTGFGNGYLSIVTTVVDTSIPANQPGNRVNRLAPASGRWMSNPTCTGGMIQFMLNRQFFSFDYTVNANGTLALVGRDENYTTALAPVQHYVLAGCVGPVNIFTPPSCIAVTSPGVQPTPAPVAWAPPNDPGRLTGTAWPNPPKVCPVRNPLEVLKGITFVSFTGSTTATTPASTGGTFLTFSVPNPFAYSGDITVTAVQPLAIWPGPPATPAGPATGIPFSAQSYTGGRYIIYPDCSGGELLLMGGITSGVANGTAKSNAYTQLEFLFTDDTFRRIVVIADGGQTP